MNFSSKTVFLALAILSYSGSTFGYVWTYTNLTEKPVLIELRLLAHGYVYYDIINPGENSSRFDWPMGSLLSGFCIDKFFIGSLEPKDLKNIFDSKKFPDAIKVANACSDNNIRMKLARIGKIEPEIKWISGQKWGTFDNTARDAVNVLSKVTTGLAGDATNVALAAGAESATGGTTAGTAGTFAANLNIGKIFDTLSGIPGAIMTLAHKSPCASRHFAIIADESGTLITVTKD